LDLNAETNALVVGARGELGRDWLRATGVNWVSGDAPRETFRAQVKIRYRAQPQPARVEPVDDGISVTFDEPQRDITPGQAAVVYQGDICLGGGVISQIDD
jgi:tRNA-specific 2-thiouridylase